MTVITYAGVTYKVLSTDENGAPAVVTPYTAPKVDSPYGVIKSSTGKLHFGYRAGGGWGRACCSQRITGAFLSGVSNDEVTCASCIRHAGIYAG